MHRKTLDDALEQVRLKGHRPVTIKVGEEIWPLLAEELGLVAQGGHTYNGTPLEQGPGDPAGIVVESEPHED